jgi:alpha-D-ribose 1-methylphosphonate 5-triphosphate synthase subunit PhnG
MTFQYENNDIIIPLESHFWIEKKKKTKKKERSQVVFFTIYIL